MKRQPGVHPNQLAMPSYAAELVPAGTYPDVSADARITLPSLIDRITPTIRFGREPSIDDFQHARPVYLEERLYIPPKTVQYDEAYHVVRLGVGRPPAGNKIPPKAQLGVAFQPAEYTIVARNAPDFARHTVNKTQDARWGDTDREEARRSAMRSAGHALTSKISAQDSLAKRLTDENESFRHLRVHLRSPRQVRIRAEKLEQERALADERIHSTVEVAAMLYELKNTAVAGLHRAIRKRVYHGNYSHAERSAFFIEYLDMVGVHANAKLYKIALSRAMCAQELRKYQPYLDEKAAREADAA